MEQEVPWNHGKISRELAQELLQPRTNGLFLVRESTNYPGDYTLDVCFNGTVEHGRIQTVRNKVVLTGAGQPFTRLDRLSEQQYPEGLEFFDSLIDLVEHHKKDASGLRTILVKPKFKADPTTVRNSCPTRPHRALPSKGGKTHTHTQLQV